MRKVFVMALVMMLVGTHTILAQGFQPPSENKSVVYFVRVTKYGKPTSFEFFHQDKYIGVFKGGQYMLYECDPGKHLLWASSENKEFLTAELEAGKTYIAVVNVIMGAMKARVGLTPLDTGDTKTLERVKKLVESKPPTITPEAKIEKMNQKLKKFIKEKLDLYEATWKAEKNYKHLSMPFPDEMMK